MRTLCVLVLAVAACGDSDEDVVVDGGIDAPPPCSLVGGTFSSFDLDGDAPGPQRETITFAVNGSFNILHYRGGTESGPYVVNGNQVSLTDQLAMPGSLGCEPATDTWTYTFSNSCRTVAFEPVGSPCFNHEVTLKQVVGWQLTRE